MLEELQFWLSSFLTHGSQFKNKINGKIENRTEKGNALYNEYQPGYSNPPISSSGITFLETSILINKAVILHPEAPYLPSCPIEWLWCSSKCFSANLQGSFGKEMIV